MLKVEITVYKEAFEKAREIINADFVLSGDHNCGLHETDTEGYWVTSEYEDDDTDALNDLDILSQRAREVLDTLADVSVL